MGDSAQCLLLAGAVTLSHPTQLLPMLKIFHALDHMYCKTLVACTRLLSFIVTFVPRPAAYRLVCNREHHLQPCGQQYYVRYRPTPERRHAGKSKRHKQEHI
jgi:hypothetical protein